MSNDIYFKRTITSREIYFDGAEVRERRNRREAGVDTFISSDICFQRTCTPPDKNKGSSNIVRIVRRAIYYHKGSQQ